MTVLNENSNAPEAFAASLAVAADHVAKKEYDKAVALYTKISQSSGDEFVARKAALSVAYITEVKGKENEAALLFARIADDIKAPEGIRAEAAYGAVLLDISSGIAEYYTLEASYDDQWAVCSKNVSGHSLFGFWDSADKDRFVEWVKERIQG